MRKEDIDVGLQLRKEDIETGLQLRKKDIEVALLVNMKVGPRKACEYVYITIYLYYITIYLC